MHCSFDRHTKTSDIESVRSRVQTAEIFAEALDSSKAKIEKSELLLPGAEPSAFLRELSRKKPVESVMCFGHAPQLDELISASLGAKKDLTELKKAGVACIEMSRIHPAAGKLVWLITREACGNFPKGSSLSVLPGRRCFSERLKSEPAAAVDLGGRVGGNARLRL